MFDVIIAVIIVFKLFRSFDYDHLIYLLALSFAFNLYLLFQTKMYLILNTRGRSALYKKSFFHFLYDYFDIRL